MSELLRVDKNSDFTRGRGRPSAQQTQLKLTHEIEDLKRENAELRARMADHFFAMSVPIGGA